MAKEKSKAELVREYFKDHPKASSNEVIKFLESKSLSATQGYVRSVKSLMKKKLNSSKVDATSTPKPKSKPQKKVTAKYPRHNLERALRIPKGILDQNAGKGCSEKQSASFIGVKYNQGPYSSELSSSIKFGLLERPKSGYVDLTPLAKQILRPQDAEAEISGLRRAIIAAPDISSVYEHYRGENLPDDKFFQNTLEDTFNIPHDNLKDFSSILIESLKFAKLIEERGEKKRIIDFTNEQHSPGSSEKRLKNISKNVKVSEGDSCFVMMPFASPLGEYYSQIYKPAIEKAGLKPLRADDDMFATGKIIDQIWSGINSPKVLIAELTSRNANVFYELGLAHALKKPVVLISANEEDVPFDLHHIRVIYYDRNDPFWGQKLIDKVAENVISAIKHPEEALFDTIISK